MSGFPHTCTISDQTSPDNDPKKTIYRGISFKKQDSPSQFSTTSRRLEQSDTWKTRTGHVQNRHSISMFSTHLHNFKSDKPCKWSDKTCLYVHQFQNQGSCMFRWNRWTVDKSQHLLIGPVYSLQLVVLSPNSPSRFSTSSGRLKQSDTQEPRSCY